MSDNDNNRRSGKYSQPLSIEQVSALLREDNNIAGGYHYLNDEWDRGEHKDRSRAMYELIDGLHWLTDGDRKKIYAMVVGSEIFRNWKYGKDMLDAYLVDWNDRHDDDQFYSVYPSSQGETNGSNDDDGGSGGTNEQNVTAQSSRSRRNRTEYEKRKQQANKQIKNLH